MGFTYSVIVANRTRSSVWYMPTLLPLGYLKSSFGQLFLSSIQLSSFGQYIFRIIFRLFSANRCTSNRAYLGALQLVFFKMYRVRYAIQTDRFVLYMWPWSHTVQWHFVGGQFVVRYVIYYNSTWLQCWSQGHLQRVISRMPLLLPVPAGGAWGPSSPPLGGGTRSWLGWSSSLCTCVGTFSDCGFLRYSGVGVASRPRHLKAW